MKLNLECIKCLMLVLEECLSIKAIGTTFFFEGVGINKAISAAREKGCEFSDFDFVYALVQIIERGYVVTSGSLSRDNGEGINVGEILYITPAGHDFLASILE